jgi:ceramide glucosyltransferase
MPLLQPLPTIAGWTGLAAAAGYAVAAVTAVVADALRRARPGAAPSAAPPRAGAVQAPVTLLKPLCGAEPGLYEHLRSFCRQDYPQYQIVFGVRDPADPALPVVARLVREFPALPIEVVVDPRLHGSNLKVSNLINMLARARHDLLVVADSDTWVEPAYLAAVTGPLADAEVGLVNCLYTDVPTAGIWSRLGAMYINDWYMPSVLLAQLLGYQGYVSGQTLCLRRGTLVAAGGLEAIADHLADDNRLGELVRGLGLRIACSPYRVRAQHDEPDLRTLLRHESRWMGTVRVLRPHSFRFLFLSFSLPLALLGLLGLLVPALHGARGSIPPAAWTLFGIALGARLLLHLVARAGSGLRLCTDLWLVPLRDALLVGVWCRCFFTTRVTWRGADFAVAADGVMRRLS